MFLTKLFNNVNIKRSLNTSSFVYPEKPTGEAKNYFKKFIEGNNSENQKDLDANPYRWVSNNTDQEIINNQKKQAQKNAKKNKNKDMVLKNKKVKNPTDNNGEEEEDEAQLIGYLGKKWASQIPHEDVGVSTSMFPELRIFINNLGNLYNNENQDENENTNGFKPVPIKSITPKSITKKGFRNINVNTRNINQNDNTLNQNSPNNKNNNYNNQYNRSNSNSPKNNTQYINQNVMNNQIDNQRKSLSPSMQNRSKPSTPSRVNRNSPINIPIGNNDTNLSPNTSPLVINNKNNKYNKEQTVFTFDENNNQNNSENNNEEYDTYDENNQDYDIYNKNAEEYDEYNENENDIENKGNQRRLSHKRKSSHNKKGKEKEKMLSASYIHLFSYNPSKRTSMIASRKSSDINQILSNNQQPNIYIFPDQPVQDVQPPIIIPMSPNRVSSPLKNEIIDEESDNSEDEENDVKEVENDENKEKQEKHEDINEEVINIKSNEEKETECNLEQGNNEKNTSILDEPINQHLSINNGERIIESENQNEQIDSEITPRVSIIPSNIRTTSECVEEGDNSDVEYENEIPIELKDHQPVDILTTKPILANIGIQCNLMYNDNERKSIRKSRLYIKSPKSPSPEDLMLPITNPRLRKGSLTPITQGMKKDFVFDEEVKELEKRRSKQDRNFSGNRVYVSSNESGKRSITPNRVNENKIITPRNRSNTPNRVNENIQNIIPRDNRSNTPNRANENIQNITPKNNRNITPNRYSDNVNVDNVDNVDNENISTNIDNVTNITPKRLSIKDPGVIDSEIDMIKSFNGLLKQREEDKNELRILLIFRIFIVEFI